MNEQMNRLSKVKKSCRITGKILNVVTIIYMVVATICTAVGLFCLVGQGYINEQAESFIEVEDKENIQIKFEEEFNGIMKFDLDAEELLEDGEYAPALGVYLIVIGVMCAIIYAILRNIVKIFKVIENSESPFSKEVFAYLRRSFVLMVVIAALYVDAGTTVIVALFLWCIYNIMGYGAALQTEVDEIL